MESFTPKPVAPLEPSPMHEEGTAGVASQYEDAYVVAQPGKLTVKVDVSDVPGEAAARQHGSPGTTPSSLQPSPVSDSMPDLPFQRLLQIAPAIHERFFERLSILTHRISYTDSISVGQIVDWSGVLLSIARVHKKRLIAWGDKKSLTDSDLGFSLQVVFELVTALKKMRSRFNIWLGKKATQAKLSEPFPAFVKKRAERLAKLEDNLNRYLTIKNHLTNPNLDEGTHKLFQPELAQIVANINALLDKPLSTFPMASRLSLLELLYQTNETPTPISLESSLYRASLAKSELNEAQKEAEARDAVVGVARVAAVLVSEALWNVIGTVTKERAAEERGAEVVLDPEDAANELKRKKAEAAKKMIEAEKVAEPIADANSVTFRTLATFMQQYYLCYPPGANAAPGGEAAPAAAAGAGAEFPSKAPRG